MFRYRAQGCASTFALCSALTAISSAANAQAAGQTLPPVTVEAPKVAAKPAANPAKPTARTAASREAKRRASPAAQTTSVPTPAANATPSAARDGFNQAPTGQTATTIDGGLLENKPGFRQFDRSAGHWESIVIGGSVCMWLR
jgi:iron complex outermembrane recepter protein